MRGGGPLPFFRQRGILCPKRKGRDGVELKRLPGEFSVCQVSSLSDIEAMGGLYFLSKTDEEISLVCHTEHAPRRTAAREDGWRAFRVQGVLDFSLVGILARLSAVLAEEKIGLFAVSTYNTDYILVKKEHFDRAMAALGRAGYTVI